jgi:hypothetical protein
MEKYKFKNPPILVGGKAMEYYNLRKTGHDLDYVISKYDYNKLSEIQEPNIYMPQQTPGITYRGGKIDVDYFLNLYQYDYNYLKKNAIKNGNILVISKEDLILVKAMTAFDKKNKIGKSTIKKNLNDISLIVNSLSKDKYNF